MQKPNTLQTKMSAFVMTSARSWRDKQLHLIHADM
jgi:hypothetical protein